MPDPVTAVMGGSAILGAGTSLAAGSAQSKAAKQAASAEAEGNRLAVEEMQRQFNLTRGDFAPYRQHGTAALRQMSDLMGLDYGNIVLDATPQPDGTYAVSQPAAAPQQPTNALTYDQWYGRNRNELMGKLPTDVRGMIGGGAGAEAALDDMGRREYVNYLINNQAAGQFIPTGSTASAPAPVTNALLSPEQRQQNAFASFRTDPGYQFALDEGQKAIERSAAARGNLLSGSTLKELERFSQGVADQRYGDYWNRLANMAGVGQTATNTTAQLGTGLSGNMASLYAQGGTNQANALLAGGQARASGYAGVGNAAMGGASNYLMLDYMNRRYPIS